MSTAHSSAVRLSTWSRSQRYAKHRGPQARQANTPGERPGIMTVHPVVHPVPLVALVILDGWGIAPPGPGNAVELADTPVFDRLWAKYPHTQLTAGGKHVGQPAGR